MSKILKYYLEQSRFSDPGELVYLYKSLPDSIGELTKIIRGIMIHQHDTKSVYDFKVPKDRQLEPNTRYVSKILKKIISLKNNDLSVSREPQNRFIGLCRDFAITLCSILRYKGVSARLRCGFATYFSSDLLY